jgi:uncharacterized protein (DUF2141 family)
MPALLSRALRSDWLPAGLIALALVIFGLLASTVKGDLRQVSPEIDPALRRTPPGAVAPGALDPSRHAVLTVVVQRVRSDGGKVSVAVFGRGPLTGGAGLVEARSAAAVRGEVRVTFEGLPQAHYAVVVFHDENGNGRLDFKGGGGPPVEGIGNSNAHGPPQGPPTWEDSSFALDRDALELQIPLFYY